MPITIDIEKDYLYNLGLKKAEDIIKQAKEATFKAKKQAEKAEAEKAQLEAKAKAEKAKLEAKAKAEKVKFEAKAEAEKKVSIQKLQAKNKLSDEEIIEILSLDKKTYKRYIKEIKEENLNKVQNEE